MHILSGKPQDRHVVIVDDLVQTGGTLIQCAKVRWSLLPSMLTSVLCIIHVANVQMSKPRGGPTRSHALPLINIPRTKSSQQWELEMPYSKDLDMFGGIFMTLKASWQSEVTLHNFVTSKRLLRARWMAMIDLDLIDSFSMVENIPQPSTLEESDAQKSLLKHWNAVG